MEPLELLNDPVREVVARSFRLARALDDSGQSGAKDVARELRQHAGDAGTHYRLARRAERADGGVARLQRAAEAVDLLIHWLEVTDAGVAEHPTQPAELLERARELRGALDERIGVLAGFAPPEHPADAPEAERARPAGGRRPCGVGCGTIVLLTILCWIVVPLACGLGSAIIRVVMLGNG